MIKRGEDRSVIKMQNCVLRYVNAKMIHVETILGIRERGG
jgi:hypothetical protein